MFSLDFLSSRSVRLYSSYVSRLNSLCYCVNRQNDTHRHILYKHTATGKTETANKTTTVINQTADTRRQMAGCASVCVCRRQLWLSYLFDVGLPRCCLLGFAEGGTVGIFAVGVCSSRCASVWGHESVCVCVFFSFLRSGFGASPTVYVSCHAFVKASVSQLISRCASKQLAWREAKRICFKLKRLSRVHSSHTKSQTTPWLNKRKGSFTYCVCLFTESRVCQTSSK